MSTPILEAEGLVKSYGGRRVVDELALVCHRGSVLGLLGPNGAGKTTTLRMLYGFIEPEAGTIRYDGRDFREHRSDVKRLIGVTTQEDTVDYDFSVEQNLRVYAGYFRPRVEDVDRRVAELLDRFELTEYRRQSPRELSGGFKRRLMIARSIVHRPSVLFLDEPTTGLDPRARVDVWELIDAMRSEGMAIILTTHYMDEAERLSDDLLVMSRGKQIARGAPSEIVGQLVGDHVVVVPPSEPRRDEIAAWAEQTTRSSPRSVLGELHVAVAADQLAKFTERFRDVRFSVRAPNLDDLFLALSVPEVPSEQEAAQ